VPLDGSEIAAAILRHIRRILFYEDTEVLLVRVFSMPPSAEAGAVEFRVRAQGSFVLRSKGGSTMAKMVPRKDPQRLISGLPVGPPEVPPPPHDPPSAEPSPDIPKPMDPWPEPTDPELPDPELREAEVRGFALSPF
jgi:hypothetical protein